MIDDKSLIREKSRIKGEVGIAGSDQTQILMSWDSGKSRCQIPNPRFQP